MGARNVRHLRGRFLDLSPGPRLVLDKLAEESPDDGHDHGVYSAGLRHLAWVCGLTAHRSKELTSGQQKRLERWVAALVDRGIVKADESSSTAPGRPRRYIVEAVR